VRIIAKRPAAYFEEDISDPTYHTTYPFSPNRLHK